MKSPLVSVVIPNYNYGRYLPAAIESALGQTYAHVEVLVVDNGSTDESIDVLRSFDSRIRWIQQENRGQAGSRNRGIEETRGELIAFLDADDVWLPFKLEKQVPLFDDPHTGLVYCGLLSTTAELEPRDHLLPKSRGQVLHEFVDSGRGVILGGESTAVVRRECFERLGGFDPRLSISTGWDMWRRIAGHYRVDFVAEPLVLYRQHGSNANQRLDVWEHDVAICLEKMFSDESSAAIQPLRAEAYGKTYLMLSGSYFKRGQWKKAIEHGAAAILRWPKAIAYIVATARRRRRRAVESQ